MRNKNAGFSLMELMMVLVVAGVILAFGVPSFNSQIKNSRLTSGVNDLIAAMHISRSEASKRRVPVILCTSDNALSSESASCSTDVTWRDGWLIFADVDSSGSLSEGDDIFSRQGPQHEALNTAASADIANSVTYMPTGFAQIPLNTVSGRFVVYCDKSEDNRYTRVLSFSNSGRPSVIPYEDANGAPSCVNET